MSHAGKLAVLVLALSLFASPVMACFATDNALTDEERNCCQEMAGQCDQMPSSHSCCQTTIHESGPYLINARLAVSAPAQLTLHLAPDVSVMQPPAARVEIPAEYGPAPPGAQFASSLPLRI